MQSRPAEEAWRMVVDADPAEFDADGVAEFLKCVAAVRGVCDAAEVAAVRHGRSLNAAGEAPPAEHLIARQTGRSSREARATATREQACETMPSFEDALADGRMSAGHVDAAATVHAKLSEEVAGAFSEHADELVTRAGSVDVDAFAKECRTLGRFLTAQHDRGAEPTELERQERDSRVKRWVDRTTGMHNTLISLDPIRDTKMWKVVNAQVNRDRQQRQSRGESPIPFEALQASSFVAAITAERPTGGGRAVPEISVLIDYDTLVDDLRAHDGICESDDAAPIPPSVVRQMACDADIIPILLGSTGEPLDHGRRVRSATPQQRNALAAMHATCVFPGCTVGFSSCRIHHVRFWWEHLGPTNLDNLLPLCEQHHHLVHDGGWILELDLKRLATWTRPDGVLHHRGTTIDRPTGRSAQTSASTGRHRDRRPRDVPLRR